MEDFKEENNPKNICAEFNKFLDLARRMKYDHPETRIKQYYLLEETDKLAQRIRDIHSINPNFF